MIIGMSLLGQQVGVIEYETLPSTQSVIHGDQNPR